LRRPRGPAANLDSGGHQRFVVDTSTLAARPSANPGLIDLYMLFRPTADTVLVRTHHGGAQFVQNTEGGFVSCQPKLPLKLHGRHARRLAGDQIRGPEPNTEWRMTAFHNRACQQAGLASTRAAFQNTGAACNVKGFPNQTAMRADKTIRPPSASKIGRARGVIRKEILKLRERLGESQIVTLMDVHSRHDVGHYP
jgi:hypothetical protein